MNNMNCSLLVLVLLIWVFEDVSCDRAMTAMTAMTDDIHTPDIPAPTISRNYLPCKEVSTPKCLVACSVSSVAQAHLSWFNGNVPVSSLTVSDLINTLYLEVDFQDKNNYSCVVSSSGKTKTSYLDISSSCQSCPEREIPVPASEGDSVTLTTSLTEVHYEDHIMWLYGDTLIAELYEHIAAYYDCEDKRFDGNLKVKNNTGSLTITNISKIHSGHFEVQITNGKREECQRFNIIVYDPLPFPTITKNSTRCSSSSKCVVLCSVNMTHVSLSWYNGSRLNSSINVSDLKSNFLCLEVENQDTNNYSCVVNNFVTNKTTILNISELCKVSLNISVIAAISVGGLCIALAVLLYCCWKRFPCQRDVSGVHYSSAQVNVTAGDDTNNEPQESTHLLDQRASSSSLDLSSQTTFCCK